jgi:hypothetical protein
MKNHLDLFKDLLIEMGDDAIEYAIYLPISTKEILQTYSELNLPSPIKIIKTQHNNGGWGNGYVRICKTNKYYGKSEYEIDVNVHGGLTFSSLITKENNFLSKGYWVGFDTQHSNDNELNWSKENVMKESIKLFEQIYIIN